MQRILVHFSCGAASAVAWKITEERYGQHCLVEAVYCNLLNDEHPDNVRFMRDVEEWVGGTVTILSSKYESIDELFLDRRFMVTPYGAICTSTMKRDLRKKYQKPSDFHVFGLTADEAKRINNFKVRNPDLALLWPLVEGGITKEDCYHVLSAEGIELPAMYQLGYGHNNCIGCVKGGKNYWNKIRRDFPDVFARRAALQRELNVKLGGSNGFFLDELDQDDGRDEPPQNIECGVFCEADYGNLVQETVKLLPLEILQPDAPHMPRRVV